MPRKPASENVVCLCRLLHLLANFSNILFAYRQTVWTQFRLLLDESQNLFPSWCHLCTRKTIVGRQQFPVAHQTKQVPIAILQHWLQHFVAYCKEMNQSILKFLLMPYQWSLHLRSSWGGVSKAFSKSIMNVSTWPSASKILAQSFVTVIAGLHSYSSSWKHVACLTEVCVH